MTDTTKEWIGTVLKLSGEVEVTKGVLIAAIEMAESCLVEFGDSDDLLALDELEEMLNDSE